MITKKALFFAILMAATVFSSESTKIGVVNFSTCITESKYGKKEQSELENIKNQYSSLIEDTEKELKDITKKLEDEEYLEGLSPEATDELKIKYQTLSGDIQKYQSQLYQVLNQAHYFFVQKISHQIAKASEEIAKKKKFDLIFNKEACFYNKSDITSDIIKIMDKNFEKALSENKKEIEEKNKIAKEKEKKAEEKK